MADQLISTAVHDRLPDNYVRPETQRPRLNEVVPDAHIPVVDLANPDRATVVSRIGAACRSHGLFQVPAAPPFRFFQFSFRAATRFLVILTEKGWS